MVKIGAYFDLRTPHGSPRTPARDYGLTLELCEEAELAGVDSVWFSEHHLFGDGYLPQPLTFAAAAAARTSRVRIGTAVVVPAFRSAATLLEEANVVDLISDGRLELGLGAGYRVPEFELFDGDPDRRYAVLTERVTELRRLEKTARVTPRSKAGELSIWLGFQGPQGARRAGRAGEKLLSANPALVAPYLAGLAEGGFQPAQARMAGHLAGYITDTPDDDWAAVSAGISYQIDSYNAHSVQGTELSVPAPVDPEKFRARGLGARLSNFLYATPEQAAVELAAFVEGAPIETVFFFVTLGSMTEQMSVRHVQALGKLARLSAAQVG